jgi:hypothetical protein
MSAPPCQPGGDECDDGNLCTLDVCEAATGLCSHSAVDCNDGNPCTDDSCDPNIGCINVLDDSNECDDTDLCNGPESCVSGVCTSQGTPCDDDVFCNGEETCDAESGDCLPGDSPCLADEVCIEHLSDCDPTVLAISTFDVDHENWTISGNSAGTQPMWRIDGGNPGGAIERDFGGGGTGLIAYWEAPARFRGDLSEAFAGSISFETFSPSTGSASFADAPLVWIRATSRTIEFIDARTPASGWTQWTVELRPVPGWLDAQTGLQPDADQFVEALGNVTGFALRGEQSGGAIGRLDNVILRSPE